MKKHLLLLLTICIPLSSHGQKVHELSSPDGKIKMSINLSDKVCYNLICQNDTLLKECSLQMKINNQQLGIKPQLAKASRKSINESLTPIIPLK